MFVETPYLVPFDGSFSIADAPTKPPDGAPGKKGAKAELKQTIKTLKDLQRRLYAEDNRSLLLVFQAMDAAGKDGTIRAVTSGINPAGCQVFSFKKPSPEELDHDFLWRTTRCLPERGRIGIFNRSYYEEVLVVRVHPKILNFQKLPPTTDLENIWDHRFDSIRDHERHLARNGTIIMKFWLNVSRDEQRSRFIDRIDEPESNWKFSSGDVEERKHWDQYMIAYQDALRQTSKHHAPWYAIPADNKPFMRLTVAKLIVQQLQALNPQYPTLPDAEKAKLQAARAHLIND